MCGLAGEFVFGSGAADLETVKAMAARLAHRGPDETGAWRSPDGKCAMAFRRLSIIDPPGSRQPFTGPAGSFLESVGLVFNGEIYNYRDLQARYGDLKNIDSSPRPRDIPAKCSTWNISSESEPAPKNSTWNISQSDTLGANHPSADRSQDSNSEASAPWHILTRGDTEMVLADYVAGGAAAWPENLSGMFAVALYDGREGCLRLTRDRLGQKPLFYMELKDRIVFASEPKALMAHPRFDKSISHSNIMTYICFGYFPAPNSIWKKVSKVLPGEALTFNSAGRKSARTYWTPPTVDSDSPKSAADIESLIRQSVAAHLVADVPVGAMLSGGVDSGLVVSYMAELAREAGRPPIQTFTAGFDDPRYDERPLARLVAAHCGTDHTEIRIDPKPEEMLAFVLEHYDEPFADSSAYPTALLCRAAREHVKCALVGDGGDEAFGGYDRYRAVQLGQSMNPPTYLLVRLAAMLAKPFAPCHERSRLRRLVRFADGLSAPPALQYLQYRATFHPDDLARLLAPEFLADIASQPTDCIRGRWSVDDSDKTEQSPWMTSVGRSPQDVADAFCELFAAGDFDAESANAQRHDLMTYLPDDLLTKSDRASMAWGLELRAPLLDPRIVAAGLQLPVAEKIHRRRGKIILRDIAARRLPPALLHQPKRGFSVPLAAWLRGPLKDTLTDTLTDSAFLGRGLFRKEAIYGLLNDHLTGRDDHAHKLWTLLVLAAWLKKQG